MKSKTFAAVGFALAINLALLASVFVATNRPVPVPKGVVEVSDELALPIGVALVQSRPRGAHETAL